VGGYCRKLDIDKIELFKLLERDRNGEKECGINRANFPDILTLLNLAATSSFRPSPALKDPKDILQASIHPIDSNHAFQCQASHHPAGHRPPDFPHFGHSDTSPGTQGSACLFCLVSFSCTLTLSLSQLPKTTHHRTLLSRSKTTSFTPSLILHYSEHRKLTCPSVQRWYDNSFDLQAFGYDYTTTYDGGGPQITDTETVGPGAVGYVFSTDCNIGSYPVITTNVANPGLLSSGKVDVSRVFSESI